MEENSVMMVPKKKGKKKIILFCVLLLIVIAAVLAYLFLLKPKDPKRGKSKTNTNEVKSPYRITGNDLTNFDLYFLQLENEKKNKIYSPLSIKYALQMLGEGSSGDTKAQIDNVIGEYENKKYTNSKNLSFANAMFIKNSFKDNVKDSYVKKLTNKYNAEVIYDDFATPDRINNWTSEKTFKLVNNLMDEVSDKDFILVNALAIDMEWNHLIQAAEGSDKPMIEYLVKYNHEKYSAYISQISGDNYSTLKFDGDQNAKAVEIGASINNYDIVKTLGEDNIRKTVGDEYTKWLSDGACGNPAREPDVNTYLDKYINELNDNYKKAYISTDFLMHDDEEVKVFAKDLKEYDNTTLQYVGIMPKTEDLDKYIENIDADKVNSIIKNLKEIKAENFKEGVVTKIVGQIPLFDFDYGLNLKEDLEKLGIKDAFSSSKADLSELAPSGGIYISDAVHKANIEFTNEGIKAAAATAEGGRGAAGCWFEYLYDVPVEEIDLTFDKPYLFLIRDKSSGEVWFAGTVYQPVENK